MTQITLDPQKFGEMVASLVKSAIGPAIQPYADRITALEAELKAVPAPVEVADLLESDQLKTLVDLQVAETVAEFFAENPVQHGQDGKDADEEVIKALVQKAVDAIPPAKDGADGVGLAGAMIDRTGELVITTTKGDNVKLGRVVGQDGISFETASGEYVAERGFVLRLAAGDRKVEFELPYMVHRGFWSEGMGTKAGQSTTHDGALWIAKRDNASKPCLENTDDWILAARKGRDGRDVVKTVKPKDSISLEPSNG